MMSGAALPSPQSATAIPLCLLPFAPDQSIAAKWLKRCLFSSIPLFTKLVPPGDALRYPLFKATPRWTVEGFGCHLLRPIIVAGKTLLDIMVVGIALAITDVLHQLGRRVQNVLRRHQRSRVAGRFPCGLLRYISRIRLGSGGAIEAGLHNRQLAFGAAQKLIGILGGEALDQRLRIGKADILAGEADDTAQDIKRFLTRDKHSGQIIKRSEEHTSELQSLMRNSYAVFCLKQKN